MDEKDLQNKPDQLSRFFDHHIIRTNPFGENRSVDRVYRRTERLAAALHLLTNHIPSTEPLRRSVRDSALELIDLILSVKDEMRASESPKLSSLKSLIRHLITLVRLLTVSGFVSIQNGSVVIEALDELGNFLSVSQRSSLSESISLTRDDLMDVRSPLLKRSANRPISSSETVKDTRAVKDKQNVSVMISDMSSPLSIRQEGILEVLRAGGEFGIKDIASNLPEYGEKTIQRELSQLVALGRVRKSGDKRWSKYALSASSA